MEFKVYVDKADEPWMTIRQATMEEAIIISRNEVVDASWYDPEECYEVTIVSKTGTRIIYV